MSRAQRTTQSRKSKRTMARDATMSTEHNPLGLPSATSGKLIDKSDLLKDIHQRTSLRKIAVTSSTVSSSTAPRTTITAQSPGSWIDPDLLASLVQSKKAGPARFRFRLQVVYSRPMTITAWKKQFRAHCPEIQNVSQMKPSSLGDDTWTIKLDITELDSSRGIHISNVLARMVHGLEDVVAIVSVAADQTLGAHALQF